MQMMKNPSHPGAIIREDVINELGLTVVAMASRLGISRVALTRVLQGQAGISANLAVRLELAGISTARAWLAMQSNYDLARELEREHSPVKPLIDAA
jgi:addiction module HigA family antidote